MAKIGLLASSLFSNRMFIDYPLPNEFALISNWDKDYFIHDSVYPLITAKQNALVSKIKNLNSVWHQQKRPSISKQIMDKYFNNPKKYAKSLWVWSTNLAKKATVFLAKNQEIENQLRELGIDILVSTNPFAVQELMYVLNAKRIGIKVYTYILSWDNITTKTVLPFDPDAILVWSEMLKKHINDYFPEWNKIRIRSVGAMQYDHFVNPQMIIPKKKFFQELKLNTNLPTILYTLGSPNFLKAEFSILHKFVKAIIDNGLIYNFNLIIRLHPDKSSQKFINSNLLNHPNISIQASYMEENGARIQTQNAIRNWVSTFKHSDLLINAGSTTLIDASVCGVPHLNIATACEESNPAFYNVIMNFQHLNELHSEGLLMNVFSIEQLIYLVNVFLDKHNIPDTTERLWRKVIQVEPGKSREIFFRTIQELSVTEQAQ